MSSFPINRMRFFPRGSRRNLYRHCKRVLYRLARPKWRGRAELLKRLISDFLRGRSCSFLLRVIRQHGFAMLLASVLVGGTATRSFGIELSDIAQDENTGGFAINGINSYDYSGRSVSGAGDVNGDGLDDLIVGAFGADPGGNYDAGQSYVVFGKADGTAVDLSAVVAGTGGFAINGINRSGDSGSNVSGAGDVNGDGLDDVIVGAPDAGDSYAGQSYVVFGKADGTAVDLSAVVAGTGGFVINGANSRDRSGDSVSGAGDVNGDGLDDLIVGAWRAEPGRTNSAGQSYVVFGKADGTTVDLSAVVAGTGGFAINGINSSDYSGRSVSGAGDVNGDGLDDVIVGAFGADPAGNTAAGQSYVVFGKADGTAVDLSAVVAGTGGFAINSMNSSDFSGRSVSGAGDVNGDGLADVIVGAWGADPGGNALAGQSYVVFGKADGTAVDLSAVVAGTGGFALNGINNSDFSGRSVSGARDVNGDGLDDLIVGAFFADPGGNNAAGQSYVVFGKADGTAVDLSAVVAGTGGFALNGIDIRDYSGRSVSGAGDVNGDGLDDLIVGAWQADPGGRTWAGQSYVVFGIAPGGEGEDEGEAEGEGEEEGQEGEGEGEASEGEGEAEVIAGEGEGEGEIIPGEGEGETTPVGCPGVTVARDTSLMEAMQPLRIVRDTLLRDSTAGMRATQIYYSR